MFRVEECSLCKKSWSSCEVHALFAKIVNHLILFFSWTRIIVSDSLLDMVLVFTDHLKPILQLITSWKKLEVDSWFHLVDSVLKKYEINAGKVSGMAFGWSCFRFCSPVVWLSWVYCWQSLVLSNTFCFSLMTGFFLNTHVMQLWFPLYSVLHRTVTCNDKSNNLATIQRQVLEFPVTSYGAFMADVLIALWYIWLCSLEEFIQTSNIGEFKKRLELLLSFHGQFNAKAEFNISSR